MKAATQSTGGGSAGAVDRKGGAAGHAKFKCPICAQQAPDLKSMEAHHDSKHSKVPFEPDKCTNQQEVLEGMTGVGVKGSHKKEGQPGRGKKE